MNDGEKAIDLLRRMVKEGEQRCGGLRESFRLSSLFANREHWKDVDDFDLAAMERLRPILLEVVVFVRGLPEQEPPLAAVPDLAEVCGRLLQVECRLARIEGEPDEQYPGSRIEFLSLCERVGVLRADHDKLSNRVTILEASVGEESVRLALEDLKGEQEVQMGRVDTLFQRDANLHSRVAALEGTLAGLGEVFNG